MHKLAAALVVALLAAPPALAAPAVVDVRVEGAASTLFEGPVRTDGHNVRATSDTQDRVCDGTNNGMHETPGPTATAATVDALSLTGRGFDGEWYPGFDDYFIEQFGPDRENDDTFSWWGILVNREFTSVGGCQYRVAWGDRVLWVWDAFSGRPFLALSGATTVAVGAPLTVTVEQSTGAADGTPAEAVAVAPVATDATTGDQTALAADPAAVTTAADGTATLVFGTAGWKRLKAVATGFVRSNRLDVCVGTCGPPPADTLVRDPLATPTATPTPAATATATPDATPAPLATVAPTSTPAPAPLRIDAPRLTTGGARRGLVEVRWRVLDGGLRGWTIESTPAAAQRWTLRAAGTGAETASLRLPPGRSYDLRFTATDALGRASTTAIGRVVVPTDDRALRLRGTWTRATNAATWKGTLSRGRKGATASVRLDAGRPLVLVRGAAAGTRVELGGRTYRVTGATRTITGARRAKPGTVKLRVLAGRLELDGVATAP